MRWFWELWTDIKRPWRWLTGAELRAKLRADLKSAEEHIARLQKANTKLRNEADEARVLRQTVDNLERKLKENATDALPDPWQEKDGCPIPRAVWSTHRYEANQVLSFTDDHVFSVPRGQVGQGFNEALTLTDTNMREGGRIPAVAYPVNLKHHIRIPVIVVEVLGGTEADFQQILKTGVLQLDLGQTIHDIAPLGAFSWRGRKGVWRFGDGDADVVKPGMDEHGIALRVGCSFLMALSWGRSDRALDEEVKIRVTLGCKAVETLEPEDVGDADA